MIDYKSLVCWECGTKHGRNPGQGIGITVWIGTCSICGNETRVSPFYDYGGPRPGAIIPTKEIPK